MPNFGGMNMGGMGAMFGGGMPGGPGGAPPMGNLMGMVNQMMGSMP